jgi:hypothetical protein
MIESSWPMVRVLPTSLITIFSVLRILIVQIGLTEMTQRYPRRIFQLTNALLFPPDRFMH